MTEPALRLWVGKTVHQRWQPFVRRFSYNLFLIDLDIDRMDEANAQCALFSIGRPDLFTFREEEHGSTRRGVSLRTWAEDVFRTADIELSGGTVRLVTLPRHLFFKFAPISLWYGYGADGRLLGIIYEVRNTFGERHNYVARVGADPAEHFAQKSFHVSPFMDVTGRYRFQLREPGQTISLIVENWDEQKCQHTASLIARRKTASSLNFAKLAIAQPFSTIGVIVGIHWEALGIWMKGAGYRRKPPSPLQASTTAHPACETFSRRNGEVS